MARILALTMAAGVATASPVSSVWQLTKPHGWSKPSVYTPPQPTPTDYYPSMYPLTSAYANATATTSMAYPTASMGACASVSMLAAADPAPTPLVPAKIAHDCITSVPFNSSAAVELLDSIRPYLDWQTTIDYIRDPPSEYAEKIQEPYDFYAEFERIYGTAKSGGYDSEFAFGFDLYEAFQRSHDGHFVYYPDSVTGIFSWGRTTPLVSVSRDGEEVPQVYAYADILAASFGNTTFTPSPLTEIDGQNATEFLLHWAQYGSLQDRDALWNNVFYSLAQVSLGSSGSGTGTFSGGGRGARIYPGETTTLTFANGTTVTNENFARVLVPFDNITTGEDIYRQYFALPPDEPQYADEIATSTSSSATSSATSSSTSTSTQSIPAPGYPTPVIRGAGNANSGYFLDGDYDDVAVLAVASFVGGSGSQENFQAVNTYLIDQAVAQGKTKLIIDVSANGGGTILQGYDLFTQLFPQILPYGANRFRAHEAFDLVGQEVSEYSGQFDRSSPSLNESVRETLSSTFNYRTDATVDYEPFTSWEEKFGPHAYGPGPDNYTSLIRWNLSDPLITENSGGIYVSGYQNRSNITAQPFAAENIVIVYDGYCASTCTIFSEFMRQQAGVRTIALGGRPNTDIIQAVGGVKGTNSFPWTYILENIELPFQFQQLHSAEYYANETALGSYSDLPLLRATNYVVNARDGIRQGDATETPLHFVYEPADCRIFYTPEMVVDQEAVWKTVADAAFNGAGAEFCVAGGLAATEGNSTSHYRRVIGSSGQKKHAVRKDCDRSALAAAIGSVFTGEITNGGDGFMYP